MDYRPKQSQPDEPSLEPSIEEMRRLIPNKAARLVKWLCLVRRMDADEVLQYLEDPFLEKARRLRVRRAKAWYWLQALWLAVFLAGGGALWRIVDLIRMIVRLYTGW
jgi:hypothetical protein